MSNTNESKDETPSTPVLSTPYRSVINEIATTAARPSRFETKANANSDSPYVPMHPLSPPPTPTPISTPTPTPTPSIPQRPTPSIPEPTTWFSQYERVVLQHHDIIGQVESIASSAMFMVPGTMRDNNAEFAFAVTRLVALLNDRVLFKYARRSKSNATNVVSRHEQAESSPLVLALATVLSVTQVVELLCELLAEQNNGVRGKWTAITVVESFKTLVRLVMLGATRGNMLTAQAVPSRGSYDLDTAAMEKRIAQIAGTPSSPAAATSGASSSHARPTLASAVHDRLQASQAKNTDAAAFGRGALSSSAALHLIAELIWIFRPLLSLLAMRRFGVRSWRAWSVAVVLDILSRVLHESDSSRPLSANERQEQSRRSMLMVLYLFRHPMFEHVRNAAQYLPLGWTERIGFLHTIVHALGSYLATYPNRYFYTATN
jgi:peroxin-16